MDLEQYNKDYLKLRKSINEWYNLDDAEKHKINKEEDLNNFTYMNDKLYYKDKIFYSIYKNTLSNLNLSIEFCETHEQIDMWNYLLVMSSSHTINKSTFRVIKIFLKDTITNKYLGLIELSCDFYTLSDRDKYIGWSNEIKLLNLKYIVCISTCVGLQPICYNLNIGKLLSVIPFSKEVNEYFYNKFGYYYVAVSTTSLYGKSIQYDRLKELKLVGYTKGYGVSNIPDYLYNDMKIFFEKYPTNEYLKLKSKSKFKKINYISRYFGYKTDLVYHGNSRGIYFGYINNNSKKYLLGEITEYDISKIRSLNEIIEWWKIRWATNRWNNLYNNKSLKLTFELNNLTSKEKIQEYIKQYEYNMYHHCIEYKDKKTSYNKKYYENHKELKSKIDVSINKRKLEFNEIIDIMEWKFKKINNEKFIDGKIISQKKLSNLLSQKYNKIITEQMIKYYWCGKVKLYENEFKSYYFEDDFYKDKYKDYLELISK